MTRIGEQGHKGWTVFFETGSEEWVATRPDREDLSHRSWSGLLKLIDQEAQKETEAPFKRFVVLHFSTTHEPHGLDIEEWTVTSRSRDRRGYYVMTKPSDDRFNRRGYDRKVTVLGSFYADTPGNRALLEQMAGLQRQVRELNAAFRDLRDRMTKPREPHVTEPASDAASEA